MYSHPRALLQVPAMLKACGQIQLKPQACIIQHETDKGVRSLEPGEGGLPHPAMVQAVGAIPVPRHLVHYAHMGLDPQGVLGPCLA